MQSSEAMTRATASARLQDDGGAPLGLLAAWCQRAKPVREAVRVDGAVIDREGEPGWVSLLLLPRDRAPLFDDPFARLGRPLLARVGSGLFGRLPAPAGLVIQRYAGQPWPAAGFEPVRDEQKGMQRR